MFKLLVVDDEPIVRKSLCESFDWASMGFEVCAAASNGLEAIELIKQHRPEAVLTDIAMGQMDGIGLLKYISDNRLPTRVVVLSGYDSFKYARESCHYGAVDYLLKPIEESTLSDVFGRIYAEICSERVKSEEAETMHTLLKQSENDAINVAAQSFLEGNSSNSNLEYFLKFVCNYDWFFLCALQFRTSAVPYKEPDYQNFFGGKDEVLLHFCTDHTSYILFCSLVKTSPTNFYNSVLKFFQNTDGVRPDDIRGFYIEPRRTPSDLPGLFGTFHDQVQKSDFYYEFGSFNNMSDMQERKARTQIDYSQLEIQLRAALLEDKSQETAAILQAFFWQLQSTFPPKKLVFFATYRLFNNLCTSVKRQYPSFGTLSYENLYTIEASAASFSSYVATFNEAMGQLVDFVHRNSGKSHDIVVEICSYIEENYRSRLSLEAISRRFFLNPSYLSTLFAQKTNSTITAYIRSVRIEKAKEMLLSTQLGIGEIARQVGYTNYRNFTETFRSEVRQTPTYFRRSQQK